MSAKWADSPYISGQGAFSSWKLAGGSGITEKCLCGWQMGKRILCFLLYQPKSMKNSQVKSKVKAQLRGKYVQMQSGGLNEGEGLMGEINRLRKPII